MKFVVVCWVAFACLVGDVDCCLVFASLWYVLLAVALCGKLVLIVAVMCVAVVAFYCWCWMFRVLLSAECVLSLFVLLVVYCRCL